MNYRIETDSVGAKQVPYDAYYGIQTMRAIENFHITGQAIMPVMVESIAIVKKAAAAANKEVGLLDEKIADAIIQAADEVLAGKLLDQFPVDPIQGGTGTSINMNINEVLANRGLELIGEEKGRYEIISPNDHVNLGQSTNDAFPTAIHLAIMKLVDELLVEMKKLSGSFGAKAGEFDSLIKMGRTHLQDAVPIRLGQEFDVYRRVIDRDIVRISTATKNLYGMNMGATAVGTGLNTNPEYIVSVCKFLCEYSGYAFTTVESLVDGTQNTDGYMEISSMLKVCMMNMSKICNDIRLMASGPRCGLNELLLPPRQPGSSIMPGKVNPVMAEVVNQVAFQVAGNDLAVSLACEAGQFELNVMEPVIVHNILTSVTIMKNVFRSFRKYLLEDLRANKEKMQSYVDNSVGTITALNPHIGYETASRIAKEAIATGKPVRELLLRDKVLSEKDIDIILSPLDMTSPGISGAQLLKKSSKK